MGTLNSKISVSDYITWIPSRDISHRNDIIVVIIQRRFQYRNSSDNYNLALSKYQLPKAELGFRLINGLISRY